MESELSDRLRRLDVHTNSQEAPPSLSPCSASIGATSGACSILTAASSTPTSDDDDEASSKCEIRSTPDRGQALYATRRLKAGTLIFSEEPLISLSKELEESYEAIEEAFSGLSKRDRKTYRELFDAQKSRMSAVVSIYYSNCYSTDNFVSADATAASASSTQGGSAIGALASRINHSCIPNVSFSYLPPTQAHPKGQMRFYAIRTVARGKELLSNYEKSIFETAAKRQQKFMLHYGFKCSCEACVPRSEFWGRSDERRAAMREVVARVKTLEKAWAHTRANGGGEAQAEAEAGTQQICDQAIDHVRRLEGLLVKEGLTATPLANAYRSLAKWVTRKEPSSIEAQKWRELELEVVVTMSGRNSLRSIALRRELEGLQGG